MIIRTADVATLHVTTQIYAFMDVSYPIGFF